MCASRNPQRQYKDCASLLAPFVTTCSRENLRRCASCAAATTDSHPMPWPLAAGATATSSMLAWRSRVANVKKPMILFSIDAAHIIPWLEIGQSHCLYGGKCRRPNAGIATEAGIGAAFQSQLLKRKRWGNYFRK